MTASPDDDDRVTLRGKILRWGNSYGIRLKKGDIEGTDLAPGREVTVRIEPQDHKIDVSDAPFFRSGHTDTVERHDELLAEYRWRRIQESRRELDPEATDEQEEAD